MKYLVCCLVLLAATNATAGGKKKCHGWPKLKLGETYVDERTQMSYRCDCKPGTGADSTGHVTTECVPILYSRRLRPHTAVQEEYRPAGIYKSGRGE